MKKKPSIVIQKNTEKTKTAQKAIDKKDLLKQNKSYPEEISNEDNVLADSSLDDDVDNLSDSDESSIKLSKRKTINKKNTLRKDTASTKQPQKKNKRI